MFKAGGQRMVPSIHCKCFLSPLKPSSCKSFSLLLTHTHKQNQFGSQPSIHLPFSFFSVKPVAPDANIIECLFEDACFRVKSSYCMTLTGYNELQGNIWCFWVTNWLADVVDLKPSD